MSHKDDLDNHADQLNPNNDEYWNSRGEEKPDDESNDNQSVNDEDDDD
ncbi:MAG: hypothetical protein LBF71_01535 [Campylobacteraceae bacterium]|jgi:hypothetical protein|nr:hypothetical protein [Campylobacteraceae bacterium]